MDQVTILQYQHINKGLPLNQNKQFKHVNPLKKDLILGIPKRDHYSNSATLDIQHILGKEQKNNNNGKIIVDVEDRVY